MNQQPADDDVPENNWYFLSKQTTTRSDCYGSESVMTVYAVKAAIGQKTCTGWLLRLLAYILQRFN